MLNQINLKTATLWLDEDGIIHSIIRKGACLTLGDVKEHMSSSKQIDPIMPIRPVLVDSREIKSIDRDAREFMASDEVLKYIKACALIVGNPISKIIGNFYMGLNKPKHPMRIFTDENAALEWLREFV